ncbi:MAG TPA: hypothetical protein VGP72_10385 [Planctomycetota bacterium]|jgi:hypothetical protein
MANYLKYARLAAEEYGFRVLKKDNGTYVIGDRQHSADCKDEAEAELMAAGYMLALATVVASALEDMP